MSFGVDYAFSPHPSISALKAAGVKFVCRYTSSNSANDGNGKNLLPAEAKTLLAAGLKLVVVAEEGAQRMKGGHGAGVIDAQHADAVVKSLKMPGIPVYFACDYDAPESDQHAINAYLDGAASVIGHGRVGLYGGYWPLSRARAAGKAAFFWGTIAWSGSNWEPASNPHTFTPHIMQGLQASIGGVQVDVDHSHGADYGEWPRPEPKPKPPPTEGPPYRHVVRFPVDWNRLAKQRGTTTAHLMEYSQQSYTDADRKIIAGKALRVGTPYYTSNP